MIIKDLSQQTIKKSIQNYLDQEAQARERLRDKLLNYYEGVRKGTGKTGMEDEVRSFFDPEALKEAPIFVQNVTKKLIDARYIAYKNAPKREADERYLELLGDLDREMINVERLTGLLGTIAIERRFNQEKKRFRTVILTDFKPLFIPGEPDPKGIIYPVFHYGDTKKESQEFIFWSDEEHYKIKGNGAIVPVPGNEEMVNPYGRMPILFSHLYEMIGGEWWRTGAESILNANLQFNFLGTLLSLGTSLQALGQPWGTGLDVDKIKIGPNRLLGLPDGATFNFATPSAQLAEIRNNQRWVVESEAYANHLLIKWAEVASTSGEHQRILEVELTEAVLSDFKRWRAFENDRFELDRVILETYGIHINDNYSVNFTEPHIPMSPKELMEKRDWDLQHKQTSLKRIFLEDNPDGDWEGLQKEVEQEKTPAKPKSVLEQVLNG
jgi:hypothetical protein